MRPTTTLPLVPVYTGDEIRDAEAPLLNAGHSAELMRRASYGLAQHVLAQLKHQPAESGYAAMNHPGSSTPASVYGRRVLGLIGSGNNGGDGLWALAMLRDRGVDVSAILLRDRVHQEALTAFTAAGGRIVDAVPGDTELMIDAILGTGFYGEYERADIPGLPEVQEKVTVVACDLPSGLNAATGAANAHVLAADSTVTFGGVKQGLLVGAGGTLSGEIHTVDIGIEQNLVKSSIRAVASPDSGVYDRAAAPCHSPAHTSAAVPTSTTTSPTVLGTHAPGVKPPQAGDHKYSRGTVHLLCGSDAYPGAAQLTTSAACAVGVGMATLQAPEATRSHVIAAQPHVVGAHRAATNGTGSSASRADAVVIGPGLGDDPQRLAEGEALLEQALAQETACVLDASGLQLIRAQLYRGERGEGLNKNVLITPHMGEARRIATDLRDPVLMRLLGGRTRSRAGEQPDKTDPIEAALRLAGRLDCSVLLKGPTTVIAAPEGEAFLYRSQAPGLATAGTGDVLAGILGALAATQPPDWPTVALHAVDLHSRAARSLDPQGYGRFAAADVAGALSRI